MAELIEELLEVGFGGLLADAADEDLGSLLLFISRYGALWVDLPSLSRGGKARVVNVFYTYKFAIEHMLLDHHRIHGLRVSERQEAEAAGSAGCAISHHRTLDDFAEL